MLRTAERILSYLNYFVFPDVKSPAKAGTLYNAPQTCRFFLRLRRQFSQFVHNNGPPSAGGPFGSESKLMLLFGWSKTGDLFWRRTLLSGLGFFPVFQLLPLLRRKYGLQPGPPLLSNLVNSRLAF